MTELETIREQRDRLLTALRATHAELLATYEPTDIHLPTRCQACKIIATIEAQIAGESKHDVTTEAGAKAKIQSLGLYADIPDEPTSLRVQIIRAAKRIIEALNLPEGGGVYWNGRTWKWGYGKPAITGPLGYETWSIWAAGGFLPQVCLDTWPSDWRESWITRTTEEV